MNHLINEPTPPYLVISNHTWSDDDAFEMAYGFGNYYYNSNFYYFNKYLLNNIVCDENGNFFKIINIERNRNLIRSIFRFLPNVYKCKIKYERIAPIYNLSEFKNYFISKLNEVEETELIKKWKRQIRERTSFKEILNI